MKPEISFNMNYSPEEYFLNKNKLQAKIDAMNKFYEKECKGAGRKLEYNYLVVFDKEFHKFINDFSKSVKYFIDNSTIDKKYLIIHFNNTAEIHLIQYRKGHHLYKRNRFTLFVSTTGGNKITKYFDDGDYEPIMQVSYFNLVDSGAQQLNNCNIKKVMHYIMKLSNIDFVK